MKEERIFFNTNFCESYLIRFEDYFKWKNILFTQYIDNILQYIECFEGESSLFPYKTLVSEHQKKIFFFERCFNSLGKPHFFRFCHFICKDFNIGKIGGVIEGDLVLLQNILAKLVSFLRKQNINIPRSFYDELQRKKKINIPRFSQKAMEVEANQPRKLVETREGLDTGDFIKEPIFEPIPESSRLADF